MFNNTYLFSSTNLRAISSRRFAKISLPHSNRPCISSTIISTYFAYFPSRYLYSTSQSFSSIDHHKFTPSDDRKYNYFQNVEIKSNGVAIIRFDSLNKKVNTLSFAAKDEATALWEQEIQNNSSIKAVIFASSKHESFIAGADIFDIQSLEDKSEALAHIESAFRLFRKMQSKKYTTNLCH